MHCIPMDHLLHIKNPLPPPHHSHGSTQADLKIKHLLHAFILRHAGRLAGALGGARSALLDLLSAKTGLSNKLRRRKTKVRKGKEPAWCSGGGGGGAGTSPLQCLSLLPHGALPSESAAVVELFEEAGIAYYYDSSWNAVLPAEQLPPMITGYLDWPEEEGGGCNEIDRLAERFIARCHER